MTNKQCYLSLRNMPFNLLAGGCKKSLYSQSLLEHELKFPVKKTKFFMVRNFCTPPQAAA